MITERDEITATESLRKFLDQFGDPHDHISPADCTGQSPLRTRNILRSKLPHTDRMQHQQHRTPTCGRSRQRRDHHLGSTRRRRNHPPRPTSSDHSTRRRTLPRFLRSLHPPRMHSRRNQGRNDQLPLPRQQILHRRRDRRRTASAKIVTRVHIHPHRRHHPGQLNPSGNPPSLRPGQFSRTRYQRASARHTNEAAAVCADAVTHSRRSRCEVCATV